MGNLDLLQQRYFDRISMPWQSSLSGAERIFFLVYDPSDERRMRARADAFKLETQKAGHTWSAIDLADTFSNWMSEEPQREAYFKRPARLEPLLVEYEDYVIRLVQNTLNGPNHNENAVLAVLGAGSLFGLTKFSRIVEPASAHIKGRLVVFYPGERRGPNYHLLGVSDGWNYLAVPITA